MTAWAALALAESCAREAGAILVNRFGRPAEGASTKSSATDPVSDADRAALHVAMADDAFNILDLNAAGAERKTESLSGGETFLASLALALALAEMVARGGGRLDAFFLDEGFGSLDPEHLDRAMDGIGRLVAGSDERLVVLVSHVAEMREAIEDLVVLDKDPITGDTIVVSGALPEALAR